MTGSSRVGVAALAIAVALFSCGSDGGSERDPAPEPTPSPSPGPGNPGPGNPGTGLPDPADLDLVTVASDLEVVWEIVFLPSGEILATERPGRVTRIDPATGRKTVVGTVAVAEVGESGLMGMALAPDFATSGHVFLCYTYEAGGLRNRVARRTLVGDSLRDEVVVLDGMAGAQIHDGCRLGFDPRDGLLFVTMGDAALSARAQDPASPNGKVLRIRPDGAIPDGNPIPGSPIYTLGHRNPQGLAWNPVTREPYVSEHGPDRNDEVNRLVAGRNYGWPEVGGKAGDPRFEDALVAWTPTIAPAAIVFYTGDAVPAWQNDLFLVTLKERDVRRLRFAPPDYLTLETEQTLFNGQIGRIRAAAVGPDGRLFLGTSNRDGRGLPAADDDRILRVEWRR